MKRLLFVLSFVLLPFVTIGQDIRVSGKVTAVDGYPLAGVVVLIDGTTKSAITDIDGMYEMETPANASLWFADNDNFIQKIDVNGQSKIDVVLEDDDYFDVTGRVTDEKGNPISEAKVFVGGGNYIVNTDADGYYKFSKAPTGRTLLYSKSGYRSQEIKPDYRVRVVDVVLKEIDDIVMEEIEISGRVVDSLGMPPPFGCIVYLFESFVTNTLKTIEITFTDSTGYYTIKSPPNGALRFMPFGQEIEVVEINGRSKIDIVLKEERDKYMFYDLILWNGTIPSRVYKSGRKPTREEMHYEFISDELMLIKKYEKDKNLEDKRLIILNDKIYEGDISDFEISDIDSFARLKMYVGPMLFPQYERSVNGAVILKSYKK